MLLTFSQLHLAMAVVDGWKIHTIREDKGNRWHEGRLIHFWYGNPRNIRSGPESIGTGTCRRVEPIAIRWSGRKMKVTVAGKLLTDSEVIQLAYNDGFKDLAEFKKWFNKSFTGKLIYWKDVEFSKFTHLKH